MSFYPNQEGSHYLCAATHLYVFGCMCACVHHEYMHGLYAHAVCVCIFVHVIVCVCVVHVCGVEVHLICLLKSLVHLGSTMFCGGRASHSFSRN